MQTTSPITAKQTAFLQSLFAERAGNPSAEALRILANAAFKNRCFDKISASNMITDLLAIPRNEVLPTPRRQGVPVVCSNTVATASSAPVPETLIPGRIYINAKDVIVRVSKSKVGRFYGKVRVPGGWEYLPNALAGARPLTAEEAAEYGHQHDRCVFCHIHLTDDGADRSVEVGYGPVCAKKYGLPWG